MNAPRSLWALTFLNLACLAYQAHPGREAEAEKPVAMLRARGLEIVDDQGRVRAQFKLEPASPDHEWPDGSRRGYPETMIFRLITADGKPRVKLTTSEEGSGLMLLGNSDATHTLLMAEGRQASLKLSNDEKTLTFVKP